MSRLPRSLCRLPPLAQLARRPSAPARSSRAMYHAPSPGFCSLDGAVLVDLVRPGVRDAARVERRVRRRDVGHRVAGQGVPADDVGHRRCWRGRSRGTGSTSPPVDGTPAQLGPTISWCRERRPDALVGAPPQFEVLGLRAVPEQGDVGLVPEVPLHRGAGRPHVVDQAGEEVVVVGPVAVVAGEAGDRVRRRRPTGRGAAGRTRRPAHGSAAAGRGWRSTGGRSCPTPSRRGCRAGRRRRACTGT